MPKPPPIQTRDLGRRAYGPALDLQRELNQAVIDGHQPPTLLLVEHDPVITLTKRPSVRQHLLADAHRLNDLGIATHETDRGGDITYHGPGQLVVYPILKLGDFGLNLSSYMRLLEQAVINTVAYFGILAHNECGATGVWVETEDKAPSPSQGEGRGEGGLCDKQVSPTCRHQSAKLCAMGIRIRKNTTMHGLALNVEPDMHHFDLIVPCGLAGRPVTSMKQLLGDKCPMMQSVKDKLIQKIIAALIDNNKSKCVLSGSAPGTSAAS